MEWQATAANQTLLTISSSYLKPSPPASDTLEDSGRYMISTIVSAAWLKANRRPQAFCTVFIS
jgi:hypothetical protein